MGHFRSINPSTGRLSQHGSLEFDSAQWPLGEPCPSALMTPQSPMTRYCGGALFLTGCTRKMTARFAP